MAATLAIVLLGALIASSGCSTTRSTHPGNSRPFSFPTDTFAYANDLIWDYDDAGDGAPDHSRRPASSDYTHHCVVVARSARQFFQFASFDPTSPSADSASYRALIKKVVSQDPAREASRSEPISIPGYADLRSFSEAHEAELKETCGGTLQSYFQRGNWRMIFPFSRGGQEREAEALADSIRRNRPPVVHAVTFPHIRINHALLLFGVEDTGATLEFAAYDPNYPEAPVTLTFDRATRRFHLPANDYWRGGTLNVYEIYRSWNY